MLFATFLPEFKANAQLLNFQPTTLSRWNINGGLLKADFTQTDLPSGGTKSSLMLLGLGYGFRLSASTELHFSLKGAFGDSQIYNLDEHILFNIDGSAKNAVKMGLGLHYLGYQPVDDYPGFRNLGGIGLVFMYEGNYFGGNFEAGLYRNSESQGFARKFQLGLSYKLMQLDSFSNLFIFVEYSNIAYHFKESDQQSNLSGYTGSLVYSFR